MDNLTHTEKVAKKYVIDLYMEALDKPCSLDTNEKLPEWYDEEKFKRGQKYFHDNRFGMMFTNLAGLLSLLAEPHGLEILSSTGRSSDKETSKQRYIRTVLHMLSWFKKDLNENSLSWASLKKVRRLHFYASNNSERKGLGKITELELALTVFGFMGYAFSRPYMFGIQHNNEEDRKCYIHFWAVIGHALGIEDKYNMCLFSNEIVTQICEIFRRYIFIPLLQVEQPLFKSMVGALVEGYSDYLPMMNYTNLLFEARRFAGIPGYQLDPVPKETICKSLFTSEELASIRGSISKYPGLFYTKDICFTKMIPLIQIQSNKASNFKGYETYRQLIELECERDEDSVEHRLGKYLELKPHEKVSIQYANENNWSELLGDSKWKDLGRFDQINILLRSKMFKNNDKPFFRYLHEKSLSFSLYLMKKQQK